MYICDKKSKPINIMETNNGVINGHEYVDLGLSVKWATCNIGAEKPSDFGHYFAWGETTTKSTYDFNNSVTYGKDMGGIAGDPTYDDARASWGGTWRLPTKQEIEELISKCKREWMVQGGRKGYKITGPSGNSIFLPAAGWCSGMLFNGTGKDGDYWCATALENSVVHAYYLVFDSDAFSRYDTFRHYGLSIRPVTE